MHEKSFDFIFDEQSNERTLFLKVIEVTTLQFTRNRLTWLKRQSTATKFRPTLLSPTNSFYPSEYSTRSMAFLRSPSPIKIPARYIKLIRFISFSSQRTVSPCTKLIYSFTFFGSGCSFSAQLSIKKKSNTIKRHKSRPELCFNVALEWSERTTEHVSHSRALLSFRAFEISSSFFCSFSSRPIIIVITESEQRNNVSISVRLLHKNFRHNELN